MYLKHRVYGDIQVTEPAVQELIKSPALKRLKGIDIIGYPYPYFPGITHTRFEHSLGVFWLLKNYGAPLTEQIAGLIHDVSHSAFSHCIEYVVDKGSEKEHTYQDDIHADYVKETKIPKILEKHGIDLDYVMDDRNFPLKEKDLPDLCADRIDYSLLTGIAAGEITKGDARIFLENLFIEDSTWVFKEFEIAKRFAEFFLKISNTYYAALQDAVMLKTVGNCLRYALEKGYIKKQDLYTKDKDLLDRVRKYLNKDKKLKHYWIQMNGKVPFENNPKDYDYHLFCKSRVVDPLCMYDRKAVRVSEIDLEWANVFTHESKPKEYFIKFKK